MKYKITIEKIDTKSVKERNWVQVDEYKDEDGKTRNYDYRDEVKENDISEQIYTQTIENINLKEIIKAVNGEE